MNYETPSDIPAAEADQRVLGPGAVGHDPAQRDDGAVALDHLLEPAIDDADSIDQRGRAGLELGPVVRLEPVGAFKRSAAAEFLGEIVAAFRHVVDGEVVAVSDR